MVNARSIINGTTLKMVAVGILILICTIPSFLVYGLIMDRELRSQEAITETAANWGQTQIIAGPVLTVPYFREERDEKNQIIRIPETLGIVASQIETTADLQTQTKKRGIFRVPVYTAKITMMGEFALPRIPEVSADLASASLDVSVADPLGVEVAPAVTWNGQDIALAPAESLPMDYVQRTMRGTVALPNGIRSTAVTIPFTYTVTVRGTDQLLFLPTALSTYLRITSNWASPSFTGAPLPTETHLSKTGFEASWNVASQFVLRQQWGDISEYGLFQASPFGVRLFQSVDVYTLTARA